MKKMFMLVLVCAAGAGAALVTKGLLERQPTDSEVNRPVGERGAIELAAVDGEITLTPPQATDAAQSPAVVGADTSQEIPKGSQSQLAATKSPSPPQSPTWPANIEDRIWGYLAQTKIEATSILSVDCQEKTCEIELTGTEANPENVDKFSEAFGGFFTQGMNVRQMSVSLVEKYPGMKVTVVRLSNENPHPKGSTR